MRRLVLAIVFIVVSLGVLSQPAGALSVKIAPLKYESSLAKDEKQKGFVDIVNSSGQTSVIKLSVRAFRQTDDQGSLTFYDDNKVKSGVQLDLNEVELTPGEGVRVFFQLDGSLLPEGDVFAAILAQSSLPSEKSGVNASMSVGTLLMVQNGPPVSHNAEISEMSTPWLQIGEKLSVDMTLKNTAPEADLTGFFPSVTVNLKPYRQETVKGPLVFAGRSRQIEYRTQGSYFGPMLIKASVGSNERSAWVFAMTGYWRWLGPITIISSIVIIWLIIRIFCRRFL